MDRKVTKTYAFVLGRERNLAYFELIAVLRRFCFFRPDTQLSDDNIRISGNVLFANMAVSEEEVADLINYLAGTIKIYSIITNGEKGNLDKIFSEFILRKSGESKINFGISVYSSTLDMRKANQIGFSIKKTLKGKRSVRYIELRKEKELSSILSLKNQLITNGVEFGIFERSVGHLIALNNPEEWGKRDYGKPASDKFSGMVPPKLARMMVNLALGELAKSWELRDRDEKRHAIKEECVVIDPFCGSGNILLEAMLLGCNTIGSDLSERAVSDTKMNIEWLKEQYMINAENFGIKQIDARTGNLELPIEKFEELAVVAEPYLGEPKKFKPTLNSARGEYAKVRELYLGFLQNVANQLKGKTKSEIIFCLVFPLVQTSEGGEFSLFRESVDEITKLGYTQVCKSFYYGRDYQVVKREIVLLRLT